MFMYSGDDPTFSREVIAATEVKRPKFHPKMTDVESWAGRLGGTAVTAAGLLMIVGFVATTDVRILGSEAFGDPVSRAQPNAPPQGNSQTQEATTTWPEPSRRVFAALRQSDPQRLNAWVRSGSLDIAALSFAVEALGEAQCDAFVETVIGLLEHTSPLVREGAVYALQHHLGDEKIVRRLEELAEGDSSPGVRSAARDVLAG